MNAGQPTLAAYLILGAMLFSIGVVGVFLNRKNVIILLMAIELLLLAVNINLVAFSRYLGNLDGQVFVFLFLRWRRQRRRLVWRYWSPISAIAIASMWMISMS
ncbi:NADH-ubiquinone oxidoreductase chain 4L [Acidithiobacillus sp. GGI-221]|nr:NADH-ubiquinone oxidoreductase chain 4L [Acidithiobacillus sp. GGI-221]